MLTGFFCTFAATASACLSLPAHQQLVQVTQVDPQCPGQILTVTQDGQRVADYVDDTLGRSEAAAQSCAATADGLPVYAGEYGYDYGLPNGLVEWYPVLDQSSAVGQPPPPGQAGYILQAFSWGDNLGDGEAMGRCTRSDTPASCAAKYQAPTAVQLEQMWCAVQQYNPHLVLWYYAGGVPTDEVLQTMAEPCPVPAPVVDPSPPSPGNPQPQPPSAAPAPVAPASTSHHAARHSSRRKRTRRATRHTKTTPASRRHHGHRPGHRQSARRAHGELWRMKFTP